MKYKDTSAYWITDKKTNSKNLFIIKTLEFGKVSRALFGESDGFMYKLSSIKINQFHGLTIYFDN